jgi:hypothetical protein
VSGTPLITYKKGGAGVHVDLARLVTSRALIQANSGGGKSWAVRQLLEETHGDIQHLVLDPEGEFGTLREAFPYVLAAKSGGDIQAAPKTAKILCRRLVEIGASAVLDLYELKLDERREFVKLFLTELMSLPRSLWRPILIVIDEAHVFAPERGSGESQSTESVITLCTQGRKRGFAAVLATQRISKLHKDAAAELLNKLIGRTGLDVDVKRAGDELGFDKESRQQLARLAPGEFFAYGPAISPAVTKVQTGRVKTTHPEPGQIATAAPPAPAKVKALIAASLADLPKEAEEEARSLVDLQHQVKQLKGDLRRAQSGTAAADPQAIEKAVTAAVAKARTTWTRDLKTVVSRDLSTLARSIARVTTTTTALAAQVTDVVAAHESLSGSLATDSATPTTPERSPAVAPRSPTSTVAQRPSTPTAVADGLSTPQQRMLDALASFEAIGMDQLAKSHLAVFSNQSSRSSGFRNNLSVLSASGYIERVDSEHVRLTESGRGATSAAAAPATLDDLHEAWLSKLSSPQRLMLTLLLAAHPDGIDRDELARQSGQSPASSGYRNNLSVLSALGLTRKESGSLYASDLLYPEEL